MFPNIRRYMLLAPKTIWLLSTLAQAWQTKNTSQSRPSGNVGRIVFETQSYAPSRYFSTTRSITDGSAIGQSPVTRTTTSARYSWPLDNTDRAHHLHCHGKQSTPFIFNFTVPVHHQMCLSWSPKQRASPASHVLLVQQHEPQPALHTDPSSFCQAAAWSPCGFGQHR